MERMVLRNPERISRRKVVEINSPSGRIAIQVAGPRQRTLQQSGIAHAWQPAKQLNGTVVQRQHGVQPHENRLNHRDASARSVSA